MTRRAALLAGVLLVGSGALLSPAAATTVPSAQPRPCTKGTPTYIDVVDSPGLAMLGLDDARSVTQGAGVVVAVVDSGISGGNPHLRGALVPGTSLVGKDPLDDKDGHGTVIAGIIGAREVTDPKTGQPSAVLGVAPAAKLMPVQVYTTRQPDQPGSLSTQRVADGIRYAAGHGAKVINVSISTGATDPQLPALRAAVRDAVRRGVVVVASAGDSDESQDQSQNQGESQNLNQTRYPAALPGVIGVAATNAAGTTGSWGFRGPQVAVSAPGSLVPSTYFNGGDCIFGTDSGGEAPASSWSAAYVSGLAALLVARYPSESPAMIAYRIEMTADRPVPSKRNDDQGWGLIQPSDALSLIPDASDLGPALPGDHAAKPAEPHSSASVQSPHGDPMAAERRRIAWFVLAAALVAGLGLVTRPLVLRRLRRRLT